MSWIIFALLSALFAGLTAVLAKVGIQGINSNLATAIRTLVIVVFAWGIVLYKGEQHGIRGLTPFNWLFLCLSGIATGLSWLCYFHALSLGPISRVAPIDKLSFVIAVVLGIVLFHEKFNRLFGIGIFFIAIGVLLTLPGAEDSIRAGIAALPWNRN